MVQRVRIRSALLTFTLLMGLFSLFGCSKKPDLDESVLVQLKKVGSDLSKPHKIEFFLYFPTQSAAEQAAPVVRKTGFEVEVRPAAKGADWLCFATKVMIPKLSDLQQIRRDFDSLTAAAGGEYDGWGTPVVK
jgi:regulator of RNase E activity RraB